METFARFGAGDYADYLGDQRADQHQRHHAAAEKEKEPAAGAEFAQPPGGQGFVRCEKIGRLNHYTALVPLEDYRAQETSNFLSKLYQNSGSKLFAALIESHSLSDRDIQDIKSLLEKEED